MNRDIKFRVYDKKYKTVQDVDFYWFEENHIRRVEDLSCSYTGDYELIEFTGLYDSNGVEIYEGDLIKITNQEHQVQNMEIIGVVGTNFGAWGISVKEVNKWEHYSVLCPEIGYFNYFLNLHGSKVYEVIGSIYENKHS